MFKTIVFQFIEDLYFICKTSFWESKHYRMINAIIMTRKLYTSLISIQYTLHIFAVQTLPIILTNNSQTKIGDIIKFFIRYVHKVREKSLLSTNSCNITSHYWSQYSNISEKQHNK